MKNAFEQHGIGHLSYSQASMFIADPARWLVSYVYKHREPSNAAMERGKAVEGGIESYLKDEFLGVEEACDQAIKLFNRGTMLISTKEAREKELANIPGMVAQGIEAVKPFGTPVTYQEKIEVMFDDVPVPVIGYIDWTYDGLIVDLKTTSRMPSAMSAPHRKQGALYRKAKGNYAVKFVYVTPKKSAVYELDKDEQDLKELHRAFMCMGKLLGISNDPAELAGFLCPNYDSFYWSNSQTRQMGKEIFGV
jgi:hypothetical protein